MKAEAGIEVYWKDPIFWFHRFFSFVKRCSGLFNTAKVERYIGRMRQNCERVS
jgi:hypothetical protein